jgi:hypothetical protein
MKKGILIFAAVTLLATFVPQPLAAAVDIDFGVKGGISLAKIKWSDETEATCNLLQPVFGVFAAFNLSQSIAIQPEIFLLTQGGKDEYGIDLDTYAYKAFYRYIHVPVLAKVRLMKEGKFRPVLFAGPAVDILLSAHEKYYINGVLDEDSDVKEYLKNTNISLVFGVGVEHMMDKLTLILDVRYDLGLVSIEAIGTDLLKTKALMFLVGVGF